MSEAKHYTSAVDAWFAILLGLVPLSLMWGGFAAYETDPNTAYILWGATALNLLIYAMVMPCHYTLNEDHLQVRWGVFKNRVDYANITEVSLSNCPLGSPALSLKRVMVEAGQQSVLISPKNREAFLKDLQERIARHPSAAL